MNALTVAVSVAALALSGCSGVSIKPISKDDATKAHMPNSAASGYIVYEPMVVVEISQKDVCVEKGEKDACTKSVVRCSAGTPFVLPDYSKPYLVGIKSGLGKNGADITITSGWMLGNVKDNSDNTAILGAVEKLFTASILSTSASTQSADCKASGLYRVMATDDGVELTRITVY